MKVLNLNYSSTQKMWVTQVSDGKKLLKCQTNITDFCTLIHLEKGRWTLWTTTCAVDSRWATRSHLRSPSELPRQPVKVWKIMRARRKNLFTFESRWSLTDVDKNTQLYRRTLIGFEWHNKVRSGCWKGPPRPLFSTSGIAERVKVHRNVSSKTGT